MYFVSWWRTFSFSPVQSLHSSLYTDDSVICKHLLACPSPQQTRRGSEPILLQLHLQHHTTTALIHVRHHWNMLPCNFSPTEFIFSTKLYTQHHGFFILYPSQKCVSLQNISNQPTNYAAETFSRMISGNGMQQAEFLATW